MEARTAIAQLELASRDPDPDDRHRRRFIERRVAASRWHVGGEIFALVAIPLALSSPALAAAEVVDGDTIRVDGQRVRMWGYDAPERRQACMINGVQRVLQRLG